MFAAKIIAEELVPELRLAGVVRHGLEERIAGVIQETHSTRGNRKTVRSHHLYRITMPWGELPMRYKILMAVVNHSRPEVPLREVVHFACGQQSCRDVLVRASGDSHRALPLGHILALRYGKHRYIRRRGSCFGVKDIPPACTGDVHRSCGLPLVVPRLFLRIRQQPNDQHRVALDNRMRRLITLAGDEESRGRHLLWFEYYAAVERGRIDIFLHLHFGVRQQRLGRIHDDNRQRLIRR